MYYWQSAGRLYFQEKSDRFFSHSTRPIPYLISDKVLRIFFASRDYDNRPIPNFVDVSPSEPFEIINTNTSSLLDLGDTGSFDDSGITPICIVETILGPTIYYSGWKRRRYKGITIESSIGIAIMKGSKMEKPSWPGPIFSINKKNPYLVASPFVVRESQNNYVMYFCTCDQWIDVQEEDLQMTYTISKINSKDGLDWDINTQASCLEREFRHEVQSTPWVFRAKGYYHMLYSSRGVYKPRCYAPRYARSVDGKNWTKDDRFMIAPSGEGWDDEMICYPSYYKCPKGLEYLFFSGNNVGQSGIGFARLMS